MGSLLRLASLNWSSLRRHNSTPPGSLITHSAVSASNCTTTSFPRLTAPTYILPWYSPILPQRSTRLARSRSPGRPALHPRPNASAPTPRCRVGPNGSGLGTPPSGTRTSRGGTTGVAPGPPRSAGAATPPRRGSGPALPNSWPTLGSAPPRRCLAVAAAGSRSLRCPAPPTTRQRASADRRTTPRDSRCPPATTPVYPTA